MKYITTGYCPYCDAKLNGGVSGGWAGSQEMFEEYRKKHEQNHPENYYPETLPPKTPPVTPKTHPVLTEKEKETYNLIVERGTMKDMFDLGYAIGRARLALEQLDNLKYETT